MARGSHTFGWIMHVSPRPPRVTFIVPCYNLAHVLGECLHSILQQSFEDFEVLVMDDCSPDDTPAIARSFRDERIRHVRHPVNIGHLANYNRGLSLARGEYVWLISADDRLRRSYVLERFVAVLDAHRDVGYVFCPTMALEDGGETNIPRFCWQHASDAIFEGRKFLRILVKGNRIAAAACIARKECYGRAGVFPLDLPYAGDWYLWCRFALDYNVAYLAEPMVNYRMHALSMTEHLKGSRGERITADETAVRWRIMHEAAALGRSRIAQLAADAIAEDYAYRIAARCQDPFLSSQAMDAFEASLRDHAACSREASRIRARVYLWLGDKAYDDGNRSLALRCYRAAQQQSLDLRTWLKYRLLALGKSGVHLRDGLAAARRACRIAG